MCAAVNVVDPHALGGAKHFDRTSMKRKYDEMAGVRGRDDGALLPLPYSLTPSLSRLLPSLTHSLHLAPVFFLPLLTHSISLPSSSFPYSLTPSLSPLLPSLTHSLHLSPGSRVRQLHSGDGQVATASLPPTDPAAQRHANQTCWPRP